MASPTDRQSGWIGYGKNRLKAALWLRMSYRGQAHTVEVLVSKTTLESDDRSLIGAMYETQYRQVYGQLVPDGEIQIVGLRLEVSGAAPPGIDVLDDVKDAVLKPSRVSRNRSVWMPSSESFEDVLVVNRNDLPLETAHSGPMIVEDVETTVVVAPGWEVVRKQGGAIILQFVNQGVAVRSDERAAIELNA